MSKTFSNTSGNRDIRVIDSSERGFIIRAIDHAGARSVAVTFNNDTAPALALAILEAAGYTEDDTEVGPRKNLVATDYSLGMRYLRFGIEEQLRKSQANKAAEAKDKAELEAEALALYKSAYPAHAHWEWESVAHPDKWLAVARKAREMRTEK